MRRWMRRTRVGRLDPEKSWRVGGWGVAPAAGELRPGWGGGGAAAFAGGEEGGAADTRRTRVGRLYPEKSWRVRVRRMARTSANSCCSWRRAAAASSALRT